MAYFEFTDKLLKGERFRSFNYGNCQRDFTYIDDIVEGVAPSYAEAPERSVGRWASYSSLCHLQYRNNSPENLLDFVAILQE